MPAVRRTRSLRLSIVVLATLAGLLALLGPIRTQRASAIAPRLSPLPQTPIEHVVFIFQENHSFDNVLGRLCVADDRCDGATTGKTYNNTTIDLTQADDIVPGVPHNNGSQVRAVNGGKMNGWDRLQNCSRSAGYKCYQAFQSAQIPNLAALARQYVISDRTFADELVPTFGSHFYFVAAQLGGFSGAIPKQANNQPKGPGWGCDSYKVTKWRASEAETYQSVPSCVPDQTGFGPFKASPVSYIPTIFNRLGEGGVSWHIYHSDAGGGGYQYATCTYFAECLYGPQQQNRRETFEILDDAAAGTLPAVSFVMPTGSVSQHNQQSMAAGDNYIGDIVDAIANGPNWGSTAIFITYDDCGCFYDHVPPPNGWGIRAPMVIVSPYAKPGFTDSNEASFVSVLAFIEHNWGLAPLTDADAAAYDYSDSFDFTQLPVLRAPRMVDRPIPEWELRWIAEHPVAPDDPN